jgi:hypothetical protein
LRPDFFFAPLRFLAGVVFADAVFLAAVRDAERLVATFLVVTRFTGFALPAAAAAFFCVPSERFVAAFWCPTAGRVWMRSGSLDLTGLSRA